MKGIYVVLLIVSVFAVAIHAIALYQKRKDKQKDRAPRYRRALINRHV